MPRVFDYFKGISFKPGEIHVATTGAVIPMNRPFFKSAISVVKIYTYFKWRTFKALFKPNKSVGTIAFHPEIPGPWYNIWQVSRLANLKTTSDIHKADHIFIFEDSTHSKEVIPVPENGLTILINDKIQDISKEHVADVFKSVFGYSVKVDPTMFTGLAVSKSDKNGTHDGVVIKCPIGPEEVQADQAYQRLIDSTFDGETSEDLRIACVLGQIALVYHKHKPLDDRFGTHYLSTDVLQAEEVFSATEIKSILEFCSRMGLDFGAVDIMRDKHDGRIYIVDVNKTCMPVLSLTLKTQIKAQQMIADALVSGLGSKKV